MRFDAPVARDGYAWWYLDALSDDGTQALTLIAFIGSVFSPYYARARRQQRGDASDYCALNVVLSGNPGSRWTMTERRRTALDRDADTLRIGPSQLRWNGSALAFDIDERGCPLPRAVRGRVRFFPSVLPRRAFALDAAGRHQWLPIAPRGRVEVQLDSPSMRWSGHAYLDSNRGQEPLESAFSRWHWSRHSLVDQAAVLYDVQRRDGEEFALALRFKRDGSIEDFTAPPRANLPRSGWRIAREVRSEESAKVARTLLDAPFYARSLVETTVLGERGLALHESLSLDRFRSPWVQAMLPFRMPRRRT